MSYLYGFGNHHSTEAIQGALPLEQNSPQHCPFGLYAEQINGTAFIAPRSQNLNSWLYRLLPSVMQKPFKTYNKNLTSPLITHPNPNQLITNKTNQSQIQIDKTKTKLKTFYKYKHLKCFLNLKIKTKNLEL